MTEDLPALATEVLSTEMTAVLGNKVDDIDKVEGIAVVDSVTGYLDFVADLW